MNLVSPYASCDLLSAVYCCSSCSFVLDLGCSYIDILASPQFIVPFLVAKITCTSLW
jgi:hypothetical protein